MIISYDMMSFILDSLAVSELKDRYKYLLKTMKEDNHSVRINIQYAIVLRMVEYRLRYS